MNIKNFSIWCIVFALVISCDKQKEPGLTKNNKQKLAKSNKQNKQKLTKNNKQNKQKLTKNNKQNEDLPLFKNKPLIRDKFISFPGTDKIVVTYNSKKSAQKQNSRNCRQINNRKLVGFISKNSTPGSRN